MWARLARPVDPIEAADVLVGLHPANARQLLAVALASSPEADRLLDEVPTTLRSLQVSTTSRMVRCDGEVRGPVSWSATMAARSASPGAGGVYICSTPVRAYDTDENRVLVHALGRILRAARAAEPLAPGPHIPRSDDLRRAIHNGDRARRALEHRSLQSVTYGPINGRMVHKARTGTKAAVYRSAVNLVQRSWAKVGAGDLAPFVDDHTAEEHLVAAELADWLERRGELDHHLRIVDGALVGGRFGYGHRLRSTGGPGVALSGPLLDGAPLRTIDQLR